MLRDSAMETSRVEALGDLRVTAAGLLKLQIDEETGVRGYVIDRNGSFLQPYREAEARIGRVIRAEQSALNRMNAGGDDVALLRKAEAVHRDWLASVAGPSLSKGGTKRAKSLSYAGKNLMDQFRRLSARIDADLAVRRADAQGRAQRSLLRGVFLAIAALALAGALALMASARLRRAREELSRERAIGAVLQSAFMGSSEASAGIGFGSAYVSATEGAAVGGDFFDLHRIDERRQLLIVADVSGKGVEAAVSTALIKYAARTLAQTNSDPAEIARALNDVYRHERSEPGSFAVMFLGVLDIASHSVAFVNAGLASAYVVRGGEPSALDASGPAIGVMPDARYATQRIAFGAGDKLVLATDGMVEARAATGEFVGEERFESWLRDGKADAGAQAIVDGLISRLREFTGDQLSDDLAVIALAAA